MDQRQQNSFDNPRLLDEDARLSILAELDLLDTPADAEFDTLVRLAQQVSGCKIALISLVDQHRQWFKARLGIEVAQTPREHAFCSHAICSDAIMIVADARQDARFCNNPLVTGEPGVIFYAGIPLLVRAEGSTAARAAAIGTLCVIHNEPHELTPDQQSALGDLARLAEVLVERRMLTFQALKLAEQHKADLRTMDLRNRQFRQAERMGNIGSWRLTLADNRTQWSEQVYAIHGLPVGHDPSLNNALDFYPGEARTIISDALRNTVESGQPFEVETDFMTARGELRRVRSMGEVELQGGQPIAVIGVFQDVTRQYALEERLRRSAHSDDLTGLPNRAHFNEFLDCKLDKSARTGDCVVLLLIDLDGFKAVNDKCGHRSGDLILQEFARQLATSQLRDAFFARFGGDEFVAVVTDAEACRNLEPLLTRLLSDLRISANYPGGSLQVTATIGACLTMSGKMNRSDLLHRADTALYEAKRAGRSCAKIDGADGLVIAATHK